MLQKYAQFYVMSIWCHKIKAYQTKLKNAEKSWLNKGFLPKTSVSNLLLELDFYIQKSDRLGFCSQFENDYWPVDSILRLRLA